MDMQVSGRLIQKEHGTRRDRPRTWHLRSRQSQANTAGVGTVQTLEMLGVGSTRALGTGLSVETGKYGARRSFSFRCWTPEESLELMGSPCRDPEVAQGDLDFRSRSI